MRRLISSVLCGVVAVGVAVLPAQTAKPKRITVTPDNVGDMIKEGVMIGAGNQQAAEAGRKYSKREMPW